MFLAKTDKIYCLAFSYIRGHLITWDNLRQEWVYMDNKSSVNVAHPCKRCSEMPTKEGHDACLGHIDGVISACCGHGVSEPIMIMESANVS